MSKPYIILENDRQRKIALIDRIVHNWILSTWRWRFLSKGEKNANSTKKQSTAIRRMLVVDNENISKKMKHTSTVIAANLVTAPLEWNPPLSAMNMKSFWRFKMTAWSLFMRIYINIYVFVCVVFALHLSNWHTY